MNGAHVLLLMRSDLVITFAAAATAKLKDFGAFHAAVEDFRVLPRRWCMLAAKLVVGGECAVVLALLVGGPLQIPAFALATILLASFTVALVTAWRRHRVVRCNCFGSAGSLLGGVDIVRNLLLISVAVAGIVVRLITDGSTVPIDEGVLVVASAGCIALLIVNLGDVVRTLRRPFFVAP